MRRTWPTTRLGLEKYFSVFKVSKSVKDPITILTHTACKMTLYSISDDSADSFKYHLNSQHVLA